MADSPTHPQSINTPANTPIRISSQCTLSVEPLLECNEGLLKKKRIAGLTEQWRCRRFVLLHTPQIQPQPLLRGELLQYWYRGTVGVIVPSNVPLLLIYKMEESDCCPTAIIPLQQRRQQSTDGDGSNQEHEEFTFTTERVPQNPCHLIIKLQASLSSSMAQDLLVGKDDGQEQDDSDSNTHIVRAWKLKFPSESITSLWEDCLKSLADNGGNANTTATDGIESSPSEGFQETPTPTMAENTTETGISSSAQNHHHHRHQQQGYWSRLILLKILPGASFYLLAYLALTSFSPYNNWGKGKRAVSDTECEFECHPPGQSSTTDVQQNFVDQISSMLKIMVVSSKQAVAYIIQPSNSTIKEKPTIEKTYLRECLSLFQKSSTLYETLNPGSFLRDYFWVCIPAISVLMISISSIICQAFPSLGPAIWRVRYWPAVVLFTITTVCLGHDTYINHWRHPLCHGLYWIGHAQLLITLGCLFVTKALSKLALGIPSRSTVSPARKVASGLGALQASLVLPLSLRAVQEKDGDAGDKAYLIFALLAFVNFFTGLYFFGRARRQMVVYGFAVGEMVYQFSLLPANTSYRILWLLGDVAQFASKKAFKTLHYLWCSVLIPYGQEILRMSKFAWVQVDHFFRCLWPVCKMVYEKVSSANRKFWSFVTSSARFINDRCINPIFRLTLRLVNFTYDFICGVLKKLKEWTASILQIVYGVLCRMYDVIFNVLERLEECAVSVLRNIFVDIVRPLFLCTLKMLKKLMSLMEKLATKVWDVTVLCEDAAIRQFWKVFSWMSNVLKSIYDGVKDQLIEVGRCIMRTLITVLKNAFETLRNIVVYVYPPLKSCCMFISEKVTSTLCAFFKKYWQIIPAGLSFNGSFLFAKMAIATKESRNVQFNYLLGSWSLFLIGCTVTHAVISSRGNLVHQNIEVSRSFLRYIDLHFFSTVYQIVVSGWHALSVSLKIMLHTLDVIIRSCSRHIWRLLEIIHEGIAKPFIHSLTSLLHNIWDSPYFSSFLSLGALSILYLHHSGYIAIGEDEVKIAMEASYQLVAVIIPNKIRECYHYVPSILTLSLSALSRVYENVYEPLLVTDGPSESAAVWCWVITCIISKTRERVRIKTFTIPVVVFYITGATATKLMKASAVTMFIWFVFSLMVDVREHRLRELTGTAFLHFQQQRRRSRFSRTVIQPESSRNEQNQSHPESDVVASFDQTECCICLDEFEHGKSAVTDLPCGHRFHTSCIREWLDRENIDRCPLCRRATGGLDRLFEVIF